MSIQPLTPAQRNDIARYLTPALTLSGLVSGMRKYLAPTFKQSSNHSYTHKQGGHTLALIQNNRGEFIIDTIHTAPDTHLETRTRHTLDPKAAPTTVIDVIDTLRRFNPALAMEADTLRA